MFCFSRVVAEIKNAYLGTVSDEDLINLLLSYFIESGEVKSKDGEPYYVDKRTASKIMRQKISLHHKIQESIGKKSFSIGNLKNEFSTRILPRLSANNTELLVEKLYKEFKKPTFSISDTLMSDFSKAFENKDYALFLALALKYSITLSNRAEMSSDEENEITKQNIKNHPLPIVTPPEVPAAFEQPYLAAIDEAIKDRNAKNKNSKNSKELDERRKKRYRQDFFMAETIRRTCRDIYDIETGDDPFSELEGEVFDGIIDTYEKDYQDGLARLVSS